MITSPCSCYSERTSRSALSLCCAVRTYQSLLSVVCMTCNLLGSAAIKLQSLTNQFLDLVTMASSFTRCPNMPTCAEEMYEKAVKLRPLYIEARSVSCHSHARTLNPRPTSDWGTPTSDSQSLGENFVLLILFCGRREAIESSRRLESK
eukprot:2102919-Amphidinium_carterae.2